MTKINHKKYVGSYWVVGLLLFGLRLVQNRTGFDPETGLTQPSVAGVLLPSLLLVLAILEFLRSRRMSKEKAAFDSYFAPPERSLTALVVGCMLLAVGGIFLIMDALAFVGTADIAAVAAGVLAVATAGGFLVLGRQMRAWDMVTVMPLLPSLFFSVFLVLTVYLPTASDPVLMRYYLPIVAAALVAVAFGQLAGFAREESSERTFTPAAGLAIMYAVAAMADGGKALSILFGGCAVVLSVFLVLQGGCAPREETSEEE